MTTSLLILLLVLACPLAMWLMMRGGHGHGHRAHGHGGEPTSLESLQRQRDELDREIAARTRR